MSNRTSLASLSNTTILSNTTNPRKPRNPCKLNNLSNPEAP